MEVKSSLDLTTHVVDHGAHFERSVVYVLCKSYLHSFHKKGNYKQETWLYKYIKLRVTPLDNM